MIGVIGCGNMASAIVKGIHKTFLDEQFLTYTPSFTRAQKLAEDVNGKAVKELKDLKDAKTIIIACKPQQFDSLVSDLKGHFDLNEKHFISIMAAVSLNTIKRKLGVSKVTRVMPNTPSLYAEGVSLILHSPEVTTEEQEKSLKYFSACSKVHAISDEKLFDQVTTVSGSGPAYVFYFAKTLADQLAGWGLDAQEAKEIVIQLFKGSARLMEENSKESLNQLIDQVTSKGGVTIEAVKVYQAKNLDEITKSATEAAFKRSLEITKDLE